MNQTVNQLIVVSNRLPITIKAEKDGSFKYSMSSGGLVSALSGLAKEMTFKWIGWTGIEIPKEKQAQVIRELADLNCVPVFMPDDVAELFYNGFSNSIIWPLFHYTPGDLNFDNSMWEAYKHANHLFADTLREIVTEKDMIWVQDYHLMLLPEMLRRHNPYCHIGFFLHTPFPSSEVYRILPVRTEILHGLLNCSLIGFHTFDYARHFLSSCTRILGLQTSPNSVEYKDRRVAVGVFPIGIDPDKFKEGLTENENIKKRISSLKAKFGDVKIMVGVDRLDYIKGVPQKLHAFDAFLSKHPEWIEKVILVQVAVPSRTDVEEYIQLRNNVNQLVGEINGKYGTIEFSPIHFLNKSVNFEELTALYAASDVCLVTSTRDGMNLVSYEYICCQANKHGVLVLSEFAGAAQSMNGAIIVNPWNTEELAQAYNDALTMTPENKKLNHEKLYRYVNKYTAAYWGVSFVNDFKRVIEESENHGELKLLQPSLVLQNFSKDGKKVILLDYDGTLTSTNKMPEFASPSAHLLSSLTRLSNMENVYVYILSGRSRSSLDKWFGETGIGLVAEHGCFYRHPQKIRGDLTPTGDTILMQEKQAKPSLIDDKWIRLVDEIDMSYRETIRPLFEHFLERTPGSYIEEKEVFSIDLDKYNLALQKC
eukprot:NODE_332_length_9388_cov_1.370008.p2 type:complete len:651 gc:universal NODE_332_length_9388_cov_1.370008:3132-5084(+)